MDSSVGSLRARSMLKYLPLSEISVNVLTAAKQKQKIQFLDQIISIKDINYPSKNIYRYLWRISRFFLLFIGIYRGNHSYWLNQALANSNEIINYSKPDIILASYPCIEALEMGYTLSKKFNIPLVLDFRDGLLFEPLETKLLRRRCVYSHYKDVESRVIYSAKLVISISEPITNYFIKRYAFLNAKTIPNGYDIDLENNLNLCVLEKNFTHIVHTGRIAKSRASSGGIDRGVHALSAALDIVKKDHPKMLKTLKIHFLGDLSFLERATLRKFVNDGVVVLWGHMPRQMALCFQKKADYLLLITAPDQGSLVTGKLFEYLASNKQILALTRGTEAEKIVRATGSGVTVSPDDPVKIAKSINFILAGGEFNLKRNQKEIDSYSRIYQMKLLAFLLLTIRPTKEAA
jgi:hypothetical protein